MDNSEIKIHQKILECEKNIDKNNNNIKIFEENKFIYLEDTEENKKKYQKYFVYRDIVFSKVEIQGIVVEKKPYGYDDKNNTRYCINIDDTTGVIQIVAWKNNNESNYFKLRDLVVIF